MQRLWQKFLAVTPTVTAAAYSAGNLIGGKLTFSGTFDGNVQTADLCEVVVTDKSVNTADLALVLFSSDPTNTTFTDKTAFALNAADLSKVLSVVAITGHQSFSANSVHYAGEISRPIRFNGTGFDGAIAPVYGALIAVGAPTYASTSDVTINIKVKQD